MKFDELLNLLESQEKLNITKTFYDKAKTKPKYIVYKNANDELHRLDGPAHQSWRENGQLEYEVWFKDGKRHRLDGPADQGWYSNGKLSYESWYKDDKLHRLDGPAHQSWYSNGQKNFESYYINGIQYTKEEFDNYFRDVDDKDMLTDLGQTFD